MKTDPYKAYCRTCGKELVAGLSELKKHSSTKKHQENMLSISQSRPITQMLSRDYHSEQVKKAEIKVAAFIAEHNLPFCIMDHLSGLVYLPAFQTLKLQLISQARGLKHVQ